MQSRRILRSDDRITRSGRSIVSAVLPEDELKLPTRAADKRAPVWDEKTGERILGVSTSSSGKRYISRIYHPIKKKELFLGTFDTIQQASYAYNAKKTEFEQSARTEEENDEQTQSGSSIPAESQVQTVCSMDLRKEIVSVKSRKYNGGGAMGFMIPDSSGVGKVFLAVIDYQGSLIGKFSEGDISALDAWLSTRTIPEDSDTDEPDTEICHFLTEDDDVPTQSEEVMADMAEHVEENVGPSRKRKEEALDSAQPSKKKTKIVEIDDKIASLRLQIAALQVEREQLVAEAEA